MCDYCPGDRWIIPPILPDDGSYWTLIDGCELGIIVAVFSADGEILSTEADSF